MRSKKSLSCNVLALKTSQPEDSPSRFLLEASNTHKLFLRRKTLCILLNDPYGLSPSMKTWPTEPRDPETSLRFHGDVAGFGSLRRADLLAVRRQLWR